MQSLVKILLSSLLVQAVTAIEAPIPGYEVVPLEAQVQAFPGGELINMTGTIEEIHSELVKLNPNFDRDFGIDLNEEPAQTSSSLEKRFGPVCGGGGFNWQTCSAARIQEGISYLRGVGGQPYLDAGPGRCSRVSCSWKAAIWWCNDNRGPARLPGFNTIADCAQVLKNACQNDGLVVGQNFNGGDWNCIVRYDTDSC